MKPVSFRYFAPRAVDDALDAADPTWRARSLSVYRFWRDLGYAFGALLAGTTADALGTRAAIWLIAALTFASGLIAALRMRERKKPTLEPSVLPSP